MARDPTPWIHSAFKLSEARQGLLARLFADLDPSEPPLVLLPSAEEIDESVPRQVYRESCRRVGARFSPLGFRYYKTNPRITRSRGHWKDTVALATSPYNRGGELVALQVSAASLRSKHIKKWRESEELCRRKHQLDWVAGGLASNFTPEVYWDITNPASRDAALDSAADAINNWCLPYLQIYKTPDLVAEVAVALGTLQPLFLWPLETVEYLLCFTTIDVARSFLEVFYEQAHPVFLLSLCEAVEARRGAERLPRATDDFTQLAIYLLGLDLPLPQQPTEDELPQAKIIKFPGEGHG